MRAYLVLRLTAREHKRSAASLAVPVARHAREKSNGSYICTSGQVTDPMTMFNNLIWSLLKIGRKRLPQEKVDHFVGAPCLAAFRGGDPKDMWTVLDETNGTYTSESLFTASPS